MEYVGNGIGAIVTAPLTKYPNLEFVYRDTEQTKKVSKHFERLTYPSVLAMFIDGIGPRYISKLVNGDLSPGNNYEAITDILIAKAKIAEIAKKYPIMLDRKIVDHLKEMDDWFNLAYTSACDTKSLHIFHAKLQLAITMWNTSIKFFDHIIMTTYVENRLKELTMIKEEDIMLIDIIMVDAIIETKII